MKMLRNMRMVITGWRKRNSKNTKLGQVGTIKIKL